MYRVICLGLLFFFLGSCAKNSSVAPFCVGDLLIDSTDKNISIRTFNPILELHLWNKMDSIDLNSDGQADIELSLFHSAFHGGLLLAKSLIEIQTLHNKVQVLSDSSYVRRLVEGDVILGTESWQSGKLILVGAWDGFPPPGGSRHYHGAWSEENEGYIAIKMMGCLGWISAKANRGVNLQISKVGIQTLP